MIKVGAESPSVGMRGTAALAQLSRSASPVSGHYCTAASQASSFHHMQRCNRPIQSGSFCRNDRSTHENMNNDVSANKYVKHWTLPLFDFHSASMHRGEDVLFSPSISEIISGTQGALSHIKPRFVRL